MLRECLFVRAKVFLNVALLIVGINLFLTYAEKLFEHFDRAKPSVLLVDVFIAAHGFAARLFRNLTAENVLVVVALRAAKSLFNQFVQDVLSEYQHFHFISPALQICPNSLNSSKFKVLCASRDFLSQAHIP